MPWSKASAQPTKNPVVANAARGDIIDDEAMIEALKSKRVFALGLDVYNGEPKIHPEYLKLDNICSVETSLMMSLKS